jgi:hypothetical protein
VERAWRWCRRNPAIAGLSGGIAAALIVGATISIGFAIQAANRLHDAKIAEGAAISAREDLETSLAQNLLRPLSRGGDSVILLSDLEADSLWELAQNSGDRLWLRIIEEAVQTPRTTGQLRGKDEPSLPLIAAVGLDEQRRDRAQRYFAAQLGKSGKDDKQQADIAILSMSLWDQEAFEPQLVADVLLRRLEMLKSALGVEKGQFEDARRQQEMIDHSQHVLQCAQHLEHSKATVALEQVIQVLSKALEDQLLREQRPTAEQLVAVALKLEPPEAMRALRLAAQVPMRWLEMGWRDDRMEDFHADHFAAVTLRLEAVEAARMLTHALGKVSTISGRTRLVKALATVATRIEPAGAPGS